MSEGSGEVLRWSAFERLEHVVLIVILFMFIISGLPFLSLSPHPVGAASPWSWVFGWMVSPPMTLQVYMGIHLAAAALYLALGIVHLLYHSLVNRRTDIWIRGRDISDAWQTIKYYVGSADVMPKFRFHEPTEKILVYWGVAVILMIGQGITGIILYYSSLFSVLVRSVALDLHIIFFFLILYVIMMHIYMTAVYRENRPMLEAMFGNGKVSRSFAEERFPEWVGADPVDERKEREGED